MKYKCGTTEAYVDEIKNGGYKGQFGVFLKTKSMNILKEKIYLQQ